MVFTAQVVGLNIGNGKAGAWKKRDHGHFVCFAPFGSPRYACAVLLEHSGGSKAAMPVARDIMTYLFDQQKAWDALLPLEAGWGGTPQQRQATKYKTYAAQYGVRAPSVDDSEAAMQRADSDETIHAAPQPVQSAAASPAPEPQADEVPTSAPASPTATAGHPL